MLTTVPLGRCVTRTALSVVFTCCPPALSGGEMGVTVALALYTTLHIDKGLCVTGYKKAVSHTEAVQRGDPLSATVCFNKSEIYTI